ncbi:hypothetical protein EDD11_001362, partial [Mortierella claussenii]
MTVFHSVHSSGPRTFGMDSMRKSSEVVSGIGMLMNFMIAFCTSRPCITVNASDGMDMRSVSVTSACLGKSRT